MPAPRSKAMVADQLIALVAMMLVSASQARSIDNDASVSAVIPSPEQDFGDGQMDIQRMGVAASGATSRPSEASNAIEAQEVAESSNEASVPVYVSPFQRAQRGATIATPVMPASYEQRQESSHAPPNYAPNPAASATGADLKTSASYGHHHHGGHHGYDPSGWLDMGAWTGGKGSFGWYADYPVGGGKHYGYGRK